jgi:NlpC/P60 family
MLDAISLVAFTQIPYQYGGRSYRGADCFGICWLYMVNTLGVLLPTYEQFYSSNPKHDSFSTRSAVKMLIKNGFRRNSELNPRCLVLGILDGVAGFGLCLDEVALLTSCKEAGSYVVSLQDWINSMDKTIFFELPG